MNKASLTLSAAFAAAVFSSGGAAVAGGPPLPDCTCRLFGESVPLGSRTCLRTAAGSRIAICALDQNVTSWKPSASPCEEASQPTAIPPKKG